MKGKQRINKKKKEKTPYMDVTPVEHSYNLLEKSWGNDYMDTRIDQLKLDLSVLKD